jgi:predicted DNA-binding antitoxin AbrB/MazE fold protein
MMLGEKVNLKEGAQKKEKLKVPKAMVSSLDKPLQDAQHKSSKARDTSQPKNIHQKVDSNQNEGKKIKKQPSVKFNEDEIKRDKSPQNRRQ